ncbi:tautomerase family protein [Dyadobacter sp. LJ53]|uniref:tautomerase family protein n=1 Tax=Dyadobacter chenwenxiniae TaxID=2906456 RepID=UPI001F319A97|nr:tautomerase family protein [Dyadobacter chenwenxiniae]MCF0051689.1 tautomerase family protein [Dyadobacter chenwenxiniae]
MPLIYINCPAETFDPKIRDELASEITAASLAVEGLPDTAFVRSTCWIYFHEYSVTHVYHGGASMGSNVVSLEVNVFEGGLDDGQKKLLIEKLTTLIRRFASNPNQVPVPVYILIRNVPVTDWGVFGSRITLSELRHPPQDASPV